jgi:hypothetical protein
MLLIHCNESQYPVWIELRLELETHLDTYFVSNLDAFGQLALANNNAGTLVASNQGVIWGNYKRSV